MRTSSSVLAVAAFAALLATTSMVGCSPLADRRGAAIAIEELDGPFDPLSIRFTGLAPGSEVTLTAKANVDWIAHRSEAVFIADESGEVDLDDHAPVDGDWSTAASMAPFWALAPESGELAFLAAYADQFDVELTLTGADGTVLAGTTVERGIAPGAVAVEEVTDGGLVGAYASPAPSATAETGPRAAVLVFSGSDGGIQFARLLARQLAAAGYPALAVSYFGSPGQPAELDEVPLETFVSGAEWLAARDGVDPDRITAFGASRGGEAALWLAAEHPSLVRGAIAPVGAGELWCGYPDGTRSAWTLAGIATPCSMDPAAPPPDSIIDLARIDGPVVLACGTHDAVWDSCLLMDRTARRASAAGLDVTALTGDGASHSIPLDPYLPAFPDTDAAADSASRAEFWRAAFEALGPPTL
ncbi:acyl-CoA thioesterase/BAAT N-terminal domain-containing protein [Agromyces sp. NPDC056379]|uniref:acyl-CoA thioesterase/BAAT N-terminal domain-containing protein n=1 Tax=unclassified Agromyces TaxID=2639701 RepID=UPI0035DA6BC7